MFISSVFSVILMISFIANFQAPSETNSNGIECEILSVKVDDSWKHNPELLVHPKVKNEYYSNAFVFYIYKCFPICKSVYNNAC